MKPTTWARRARTQPQSATRTKKGPHDADRDHKDPAYVGSRGQRSPPGDLRLGGGDGYKGRAPPPTGLRFAIALLKRAVQASCSWRLYVQLDVIDAGVLERARIAVSTLESAC